eukprot:7712117-Alexandrium_andersonii.AAC.1
MASLGAAPNFITNTVVFVNLDAVEVPLVLTTNAHLGIRMCDFPCDCVPDEFHTWRCGSSEVSLAPGTRAVPESPRESIRDTRDLLP